MSIPSVSSTQTVNRISGLDQEPANPPTVGNATLSPVEVGNPACEQGLAWFLDVPPSSSSPARAAQAGPGECHTWDTPMRPWGAATGIYNQKTHQESPFPPSSKGEGRKSVQGFERSW